MKRLRTVAAALATATLLTVSAQAVVYINETFETDTVGVAVTDPALMYSGASPVTLTIASPGIGTGQAGRYNDASGSVAGFLEYNAGGSALGSLYISFDLLNNAPGSSGAAANPIIFSAGNWSAAAATQLNSSNKRSFGVEFNQTGSSGTLKIKSDTAAPATVTHQSVLYNSAVVQQVQIWANDNDATTLSYFRPDTSALASLAANSFVVWINGSLVGTELDSGQIMSLNAASTGNTTGNTTLGRVGFNSTTTVLADFSIDNFYVADPVPVPEPATTALLLGGGLMLLRRSRRTTLR